MCLLAGLGGPAARRWPAVRESHEERAQRMLSLERSLWRTKSSRVAGVDEVGLGPLAGPVVAAAVVLPATIGDALGAVDDSKKLSAAKRCALVPVIYAAALAVGIGEATTAEIDELNIYWAARLAATRAVEACDAALAARQHGRIAYLLLDAHPLPDCPLPQLCVTGGDQKSQSIAAASIVAKVARDAEMKRLGRQYPAYGLERHAGYPTRTHLEALRTHGASPVHRSSFKPVAAARRFSGSVAAGR